LRINFGKKVITFCKKAKTVAIMGHKSADFDSICSCIAMQMILKKHNIESDIIIEKPLEKNFEPITRGITLLTESKIKYDVMIIVDSSEMISSIFAPHMLDILKSANTTFKIDHHFSGMNSNFATFNFVDPNSSSACEVIYYMFNGLIKMDTDLAKTLYLGIYTDTGGFRFSNAKSKTFSALASLTKFDFAPDRLVHDCVSLVTESAFLITQVAFQSIKFFQNKQIVVSTVRYEDFERLKCGIESSKFMPSYLQDIDGVKIGISITEKTKNEYNISLRTACDDIDVSKVAMRFNGGGHIRASGLTLKGDYNKALNALLLECKKEIKK